MSSRSEDLRLQQEDVALRPRLDGEKAEERRAQKRRQCYRAFVRPGKQQTRCSTTAYFCDRSQHFLPFPVVCRIMEAEAR